MVSLLMQILASVASRTNNNIKHYLDKAVMGICMPTRETFDTLESKANQAFDALITCIPIIEDPTQTYTVDINSFEHTKGLYVEFDKLLKELTGYDDIVNANRLSNGLVTLDRYTLQDVVGKAFSTDLSIQNFQRVVEGKVPQGTYNEPEIVEMDDKNASFLQIHELARLCAVFGRVDGIAWMLHDIRKHYPSPF